MTKIERIETTSVQGRKLFPFEEGVLKEVGFISEAEELHLPTGMDGENLDSRE